MDSYDPNCAPDPAKWLKLDDDERMFLIRQYHDEQDEDVPYVHILLHLVVENQAALGDEKPVAETLARLMREGLTRHQAIHAVALVFMETVMSPESLAGADGFAEYYKQLRTLTAEDWYQLGRDD